MKASRISMAALVGAVFLGMNATSVHGWGPYAHWLVGDKDGLGIRANLPDYWGRSYDYDIWPRPQGWVIPLFPWTHGCMRTGDHKELLVLDVPNEPTSYGQAQAIAEWDMYRLVGKMSCAHQQALNATQMVDTARGFLVHNKFDEHGHFRVFPAGSKEKWGLHALLESYVDFRMVDDPPGTLQAQGTIPKMIGLQGHAGIVLLAQKCFRKNRCTIDQTTGTVTPVKEPGPVETLQETNNRFDSTAAHLSPAKYLYDDYETLCDRLDTLGLDEDRLNDFMVTVLLKLPGWTSDARSALTAMPAPGPSGCLEP